MKSLRIIRYRDNSDYTDILIIPKILHMLIIQWCLTTKLRDNHSTLKRVNPF